MIISRLVIMSVKKVLVVYNKKEVAGVTYKKYDYDSFQILTIQTDKFKNCYMEINFRDDIREINSTRRSFLTDLLVYSSLKYPTKREMIIAEEELYNLSGGSGCYRVGYNICSYFSMNILHPKFVMEKDYLDKSLQFCFELLLNPNIKDGLFDEKSFEIIKESFHVSVDQYKENPRAYARVESEKLLFPDSITGTRIIGTHEEIDNISREDLVKEYKTMFQNSCCEILIIGDLDMDKMAKKIAQYFYKPSIVKKEIPFKVENSISSFKEHRDASHFNQTHLLQYYQFPLLSYYEKNFVFPLFQKIFGQGSLSDKLGLYLRMENSLCYNYNFSYFTSDGYGLVNTQLKKENVSLATKYIDKAFQEMKKGDFTEEELETQKNKMLSDLKLREDSIYGLIDNYYYHEIFDAALIEEYYHEVMSVTKEDIKKLAQKMNLSFRYILEEEEVNERN